MGRVIDLREKTSAVTTFNFDDIDISSIDPSSVDLGSEAADCAVIAQAFERAAHSTPSEAAVFAPLYRMLTNNTVFSTAAISALNGFIKQPEESAAEATQQAANLATKAGIEANPTEMDDGTRTQIDNIMRSLNLDEKSIPTHGGSFGKNMMDWVKDCIPCGLRLTSFLELNPAVDLLKTLEADLKNRLANLTNILGLLKHMFDGDICELMNLLSFMCVPDLQRIIAILMALMLLEIPELDGLIGLLQGLIAPIFSPILTSINALLDQFIQLILNPIECVIDALMQQMKKLEVNASISIGSKTYKAKDKPKVAQNMMQDAKEEVERARKEISEFATGLQQSVQELTKRLQDAVDKIKEKADFYIKELNALLGELNLGDASYLRFSMKKLKTVKLINFVVALIKAKAQGHTACSGTGKIPEISEIDSFFNNYLNPNSSFNLWVDDDGNIHADEKTGDMDPSLLSKDGNMFQFEGEGPLNPDLAQAITETKKALSEAAHVVMPCRFETQVDDAQRVNQWIEELNKM